MRTSSTGSRPKCFSSAGGQSGWAVAEVQRCPAVARALGAASFDPEVVERGERPGDGALYGWVTPIEVLAHKPVAEAPHVRDLDIEPSTLGRKRRIHISAEQFDTARRVLRRV